MIDFLEDESGQTTEVKSYLVPWKAMPDMLESSSDSSSSDFHQNHGLDGVYVEDVDAGEIDDPSAIALHTQCPKCEAKNPVTSVECRKCGVILQKLQQMNEHNFRTTERVRVQWERVIANYEDERRHDVFLRMCQEDLSLPFAAHKYQSILDVDPQEDIAIEMKKRVNQLVQSSLTLNEAKFLKWKEELSRPSLLSYSVFGFLGVFIFHFILGMNLFRALGAVVCIAGLFGVFRKIFFSK